MNGGVAIVLAGLLVSLLASVILRTGSPIELAENAAAGMAGALAGGWLLAPILVGADPVANAYDPRAILFALLGALLFIAVLRRIVAEITR